MLWSESDPCGICVLDGFGADWKGSLSSQSCQGHTCSQHIQSPSSWNYKPSMRVFFFSPERGSLLKRRHVPTPSYSMGPAGKSCTAGLSHRTAPTKTAPRCCGCKWRSRACTASTAVAHNETYSWGPPQAQKKKRVSTAIPFETTPKRVPKPEKSRIFCSPKADNSPFSLSPARPAEKAHHVPAQHVLRGQKGIGCPQGPKTGSVQKETPLPGASKSDEHVVPFYRFLKP